MAAVRGAALPITVTVTGVDLTGATEIIMAFGANCLSSPELTKKKSLGAVTVSYNAGTGASTLALTIADSETANWRGDIQYALWIDDGSTGGYWTPDNGGHGTIQFDDALQRA